MVLEETFTITDQDDLEVACSRWLPLEGARAVVQIAHGWAEHRRRYARTAEVLAGAGLAVYADDHLGHGETGLRAGGLGDFRPRGMQGVVEAVHDLSDRIRSDLPGVPLFLLGHSWGSQIAKRYARLWGDQLAGLLLTGTGHLSPAEARERARPSAPPPADERPAEERYAWLSSDGEEVRAYVEDPLCGFESLDVRPADPGRAYLLEGSDADLPPGLPVLIFNGAEDRAGGEAGTQRLAEHYRAAGLSQVTARVYPGGRHELFNDVMRDQVLSDVIGWIGAVLAG
jgi:alpha-beta hydrolase superfamily lysophospholipase